MPRSLPTAGRLGSVSGSAVGSGHVRVGCRCITACICSCVTHEYPPAVGTELLSRFVYSRPVAKVSAAAVASGLTVVERAADQRLSDPMLAVGKREHYSDTNQCGYGFS